MIHKQLISKKPIPIDQPADEPTGEVETESSGPNKPLGVDLAQNVTFIKDTFTNCSDLVVREFTIGYQERKQAALCYIDGLIDKVLVNDNVLNNLTASSRLTPPEQVEAMAPLDYYEWVEQHCLSTGEVKKVGTFADVDKGILSGDAVLLIEGWPQAFVIGAKGWASRAISEAQTEVVLRGPREAFTETLRINTSIMRRRLKTNKLKMEAREIGTITKTNVAIAYLDGVVNEDILTELNARLDKIKEVDSVLEGGCIEQYIEDSPYSPFPQIQYTERPDKVAAALLEGRVAVIVDGTPDVLILPSVFIQFLQSSEDYYNRILAGTALRWIRYLGIFIAITLPSLYVAITSFHPEMLPANLALSIAAAREGIPFPAFMEALVMEIALELLREASIRLPGSIGSALGVVGALVIGQAAVEAKIVAPQMVMIVAFTAIGSFTVPIFEASYPIRLIRFPLMILAAVLGLYGVMIGWIAILIHLIALRSFGFPYFEPLAPLKLSGLKDVLFRAPRWQMMTKPQFREPTEAPPKGFLHRTFMNFKSRGQKSRENRK